GAADSLTGAGDDDHFSSQAKIHDGAPLVLVWFRRRTIHERFSPLAGQAGRVAVACWVTAVFVSGRRWR
ncbi:hypothetical protein, partial [Immundisolibacter sp.]|uniref:hypothetical protein n=1 Tax=Immundisolibacter sp. TaxID=1934948 RepID=UPI003F86ED97